MISRNFNLAFIKLPKLNDPSLYISDNKLYIALSNSTFKNITSEIYISNQTNIKKFIGVYKNKLIEIPVENIGNLKESIIYININGYDSKYSKTIEFYKTLDIIQEGAFPSTNTLCSSALLCST